MPTNPGAAVTYNPSNPFNVDVPGTGDFSGAEMNSAQGNDVNGNPVDPSTLATSTGYAPAPTPSVPSSIDSSTLAPPTPIPYVTAQPTTIPDVSTLPTSSPYYSPASDTLSEVPGEQKASSLDAQTEQLNNEDSGKAADTTTEESAAGIPQLTEQQQDLTAQLASLKDEAAAIPNQLQLSATGRGITSDGLAPVQTAALRNNSIQALGISAMVDATNGLLASANTKVTNAIAAKYGPIEAQIKANTANLDLILKDPQTTEDEANRAEAQKQALTKQAAQVAQQKQDSTDVLTASITAAKNGADAVTLQKMQAAPNGAAALAIATAAGYGTSDVNDLMTKYPDAKIQPGDTLAQAQQKVLSSPTYTMAQKTAMLDIQTKEETLANNAPTDPQSFIQSLPSFSGVSYYTATNTQGLSSAQKNKYTLAAQTSGAIPLTPALGSAMDSITESQSNLSDITSFISGAKSGQSPLPPNFWGQPGQYADVKLQDYLQTNNQLDAYNSWMGSIPSLLSGLKGAGSGGAGASRLFNTISTLLPSMTDTLPVALQKLQTVNTILNNGAASILNVTPTQLQATQSGFDYKAMITAGYTDAQIAAALKSSTSTQQ